MGAFPAQSGMVSLASLAASAPGLSPGLPSPLFAASRPEKSAKIDLKARLGRAEPKPSAAQQTIRVELGEEVLEHRAPRRRRSFAFLALLILLLVVAAIVVLLRR
jgi:hypothetical protein